ncbi:unnamed protein product [Cyberlindnera jadinii]|uniref:Uncharacterized protein n=1 Tax=Cyberlindnera jadinii (strain ATCC 18201 / CBS 1600 / BCRC 20928 / JCM 3617 / NBRC 0987 / NRRL Y-1542) TaxID=983966 RepID=A0A0H5C384_CYBJN|nr:unnamed protein product [Cyberlindnera jadinii]
MQYLEVSQYTHNRQGPPSVFVWKEARCNFQPVSGNGTLTTNGGMKSPRGLPHNTELCLERVELKVERSDTHVGQETFSNCKLYVSKL